MGRYYSGDIEGKFWFAVQPSNAADRFGVTGQSEHISYFFDKENLSDIKYELGEIEKNLGKYKEKLDKFFEKNCGYNDEEIARYLRVRDLSKVQELLRDYVDYKLGTQILECVEKNGSCYFEAEL